MYNQPPFIHGPLAASSAGLARLAGDGRGGMLRGLHALLRLLLQLLETGDTHTVVRETGAVYREADLAHHAQTIHIHQRHTAGHHHAIDIGDPGGAGGQQLGAERAFGVERVDEALHGVAVKDDGVLDRLLRLPEDVDDVLRELAAEDGGDGRHLGAEVLQKRAEELGPQRLGRQVERLVFLRGQLREELEVVVRGRQAGAGGPALDKLPERAQARQRGRDGAQAALGRGVLCGERGDVAGEEPGRVELALGDGLDGAAALAARLHAEDGARARLLLRRLRGHVAGRALNDKVVLDEVAEQEAVEAVGAGRVKGLAVEAGRRVDKVESVRVQVGGDDDVEAGKVAGAFALDALGVDVHLHARVEPAQGGRRGLGAVAPDVARAAAVALEELRAEVGVRDGGAVEDGDGADACEDEVLGDLVGEGAHGDEQDAGVLDLGLRGHAPETDLAVIEGDFVSGYWLGLWRLGSRHLAVGKHGGQDDGRIAHGQAGHVGVRHEAGVGEQAGHCIWVLGVELRGAVGVS